MKTTRKPVLIAGIVLLAIVACIGMASACTEGCTPGFWKRAAREGWPSCDSIGPNTPLPGGIDLNGVGGPDTYLDALQYKGGDGIPGAQRIYLRAWVAGVLNTCAGIDYYTVYTNDPGDPLDDPSVVWNDRQSILTAASEIDWYNNLGCPFTPFAFSV